MPRVTAYFMGICVLVLSLSLAGRASAADPIDPLAMYGKSLEFDIQRNGETVGSHRVTFSKTDDGFRVESKSSIEVPFLWFTAYEFNYRSIAEWTRDNLQTLSIDADDDGEIFTMSVDRHDGTYRIQSSTQENVDYSGFLFPTNHWHPGVLDQQQVLNTLTGVLNEVTIRKIESQPVQTERGYVYATRYDYSGDLEVSVWYDSRNRWVRMSFEGRDGSSIVYECRRCQGGNGIT